MPTSIETQLGEALALRRRVRLSGGECTISGIRAALSPLADSFSVRDLFGHKTLAMTGRYVERATDMVCTTGNSVADALNVGTTSPVEAIELAERQ